LVEDRERCRRGPGAVAERRLVGSGVVSIKQGFVGRDTLKLSFPRKRESRATAPSLPLDPRFRATGCTHRANSRTASQQSPLSPLWERDRVRGLAPAGADESVPTSAHGV